jgi:hypothetical protein
MVFVMKKVLSCLLAVLLVSCSSTDLDSKAKKTERLNKIKLLALACYFYAGDQKTFPENMEDLKSYFKDEGFCSTFPGSGGMVELKPSDFDSYQMVAKGGFLQYTKSSVICMEKTPDSQGFYAVVYMDGRTDLIKNPSANKAD